MRFVVPVLSAAFLAGSTLVIGGPDGIARGDTAALRYPYTCNQDSLTADFAARDELPQTQDPPGAWYQTNSEGHYPNGGWGPRASALPAPTIPQDAGCDSTTWMRERILAVAMRYIYAPDNPLGLQYRHHHIPAWDPSTSTDAGAPEENPDSENSNAQTAWSAGRGLDCSNFTAWVYDYGLGIKFNGDVHQQFDGTAGPMGSHIPASGPFELGDLIFLHPDASTSDASHVVIFIDDQHVIDSRIDAQDVAGVQIRSRSGWYRSAVLEAWRPIG